VGSTGTGTPGGMASIIGKWNIRDIATGNSCAFPINVIGTYHITVTQSGNAFLLTTPKGTFQAGSRATYSPIVAVFPNTEEELRP